MVRRLLATQHGFAYSASPYRALLTFILKNGMKATQSSHASENTLDVSDDTLVFPAVPAAIDAFAALQAPASATQNPPVFSAVNPFVRQPLRFQVTKEDAPAAATAPVVPPVPSVFTHSELPHTPLLKPVVPQAPVFQTSIPQAPLPHTPANAPAQEVTPATLSPAAPAPVMASAPAAQATSTPAARASTSGENPKKKEPKSSHMPRFEAWAPPAAIPVSSSNVHALLMHAQQLAQKPDVKSLLSMQPVSAPAPIPQAANEASAPVDSTTPPTEVKPVESASLSALKPSSTVQNPFSASPAPTAGAETNAFKVIAEAPKPLTSIAHDGFPEKFPAMPTLHRPAAPETVPPKNEPEASGTEMKPQPHRFTSLYQKQPAMSAGYVQKSRWQRTPTGVKYGAIAAGIVGLHALFMYFVGQDSALQTYRDAQPPVLERAAAVVEPDALEIPVVSEITQPANAERRALAEPVLDLDAPVTPKAKPPVAVKSTFAGNVKHNPSKAVPIKDVIVADVPDATSSASGKALPLLLPEAAPAPLALAPTPAPGVAPEQPAAPVATPTVAIAPPPVTPAAPPTPSVSATVAAPGVAPVPAVYKPTAEKTIAQKTVVEKPEASAATLAKIAPAAAKPVAVKKSVEKPVTEKKLVEKKLVEKKVAEKKLAPTKPVEKKIASPFVAPTVKSLNTTTTPQKVAVVAPKPVPAVTKKTLPIQTKTAAPVAPKASAAKEDDLLRLLNQH